MLSLNRRHPVEIYIYLSVPPLIPLLSHTAFTAGDPAREPVTEPVSKPARRC